ncbi:MAG TPA: sulfite exporter TauE/SafE family protein [Xanthobacteraceae bacterium]|nr:sulfite exporter TauE/SafE family protein [Xanthobacteraceae bacterium]
MTLLPDILGLLSGSAVGFSLGLVGGGGSILAVPLMIYAVGVPSVHVAIGTSAFAVAVNAAANLISHARAGNVKWRCASVFAAAGIVGAFAGSTVSKQVDGQHLLAAFAMLMLVIAGIMFFRRSNLGNPDVRLNRENLPWLLISGFAAGSLSGFFGIGGGFLIVPGLMFAAGMPALFAIGSSLVAVSAFGATAAFNYALSGLVDWRLALVFVLGGAVGGLLGGRAARWIGKRRGALNILFAAVICLVAIYMLVRSVLG